MKILKITLKDFRSLSDNHDYITLTDNVIAIVGKNGSGKSNILAALDGLQFFRAVSHKTIDNRNRFCDHSSVKISIDIEIKPDDYACLVSKDGVIALPAMTETVQFSFFKENNSGYFMSFGVPKSNGTVDDSYFTRILKQDTEMAECFAKLLVAAKKENTQNWQQKDLNARSNAMYWFEHYATVFIDSISFDWLKRYSQSVPEQEIKHLCDKYRTIMDAFGKIMPQIFTYKNENLLDCYKRDELEKDKKKFIEYAGLNKLIGALGETPDSFLQAMGNQQTPECQTVQRRFQRKLLKFNNLFNQKYNACTEQVELTLHFDHEQCVINVATHEKDTTFRFSERSNGLKWYLGFFAALQYAGISGSALILIDEPAVHLHVDAQKEVLQLFDSLAKDGHQLIYTTHSPSVLDINRWERIRTVEKENDLSHIYMLHESHAGEKRLETLSPIQHAMGCCLKNTLAPDATRINLVTEGITDYYYCKAMLVVCGVALENQPYIIPACSADNIPNIISILLGWGYNFRILLDHDMKGKSICQHLKKGLGESLLNYVAFVSDTDGQTIENMLTENDRKKFESFDSKGNHQKAISAIDFMNAVIKREYTPEQGTIENFKAVFSRLGFCPLKFADSTNTSMK